MSTTFAQLKTTIEQNVFPEGLAESLAIPFAASIKDALIDLQRFVECLTYDHTDRYPQSATFYHCAKSFVNVPDSGKAIIHRVSSIVTGAYCRRIVYRQVEYDELTCWARSLLDLVDNPLNTGLPCLPLGMHYPEASTDSEYGRALVGIWAIHKKKLYVAPWLQSDESLLVEWAGKKLAWLDGDIVPEDQDVLRAIGLFVKKDHPEWFDNGTEFYAKWRDEYETQRADLIHECREINRVRKDNTCQEDVEEELELIYTTLYGTTDPDANPAHDDDPTRCATTPGSIADPEDAEVDFAFIADYGSDDANELAVSELVKGRTLNFVVTGGDNWNPLSGATTPDYDASVGKYYADYIHPYEGSALYGPGAASNYFWPAIGNHDYNGSAELDEYLAYFKSPKVCDPFNGRYYEKAIGAVHLFFLNPSGYETSGITSTSPQALWLQKRLAMSTAPWKIVIVHEPPYSSSTHGSQEHLQWPFADWGVRLVLSGHDHVYERLLVDTIPYIVAGIGGRNLYTFGTPLTESVVRYNSKNGALFINATCDTLIGTALDVDEVQIDTFTLTK